MESIPWSGREGAWSAWYQTPKGGAVKWDRGGCVMFLYSFIQYGKPGCSEKNTLVSKHSRLESALFEHVSPIEIGGFQLPC